MGRTHDSALISNEVLRLVVTQVLVENAIESSRLVLVSVHAILDVLRGISGEVIGLTLPVGRCQSLLMFRRLNKAIHIGPTPAFMKNNQLLTSMCSRDPAGKLSLWSLSYRSTRYCR